jgi:hypothetical protein
MRRVARSPRKRPGRHGSRRQSSRLRPRRRAGARRPRAARAAARDPWDAAAAVEPRRGTRPGRPPPRRARPRATRARQARVDPREQSRRPGPCAPGSGRRCRPPTPLSQYHRTPGRSRAPAMPRGRGTHGAPVRRGGASARSPASQCARRRRPASRPGRG